MKKTKTTESKEPAETLKHEPEADKKHIEELTNDLKRVQADFENYKKREEKDKLEFLKYCNKEILLKLLTLLDDFENSLQHIHDNETKKGVNLLHEKLLKILEDHGVRPIKALGEKFDPFRHECLVHETSDKEPGTILEEIQKGYLYHGKILRYAKVKVSKGAEAKNGENKLE